MACRMALFMMPYMVANSRLLNIPICVARYLDLRSCFITIVLYGGLNFLLVRALTSLRTSLVICVKSSLNSKAGLMCTPSILYVLLGGRFVMWDPSRKKIVSICSCNRVCFLWFSGLPRAQRDPVATHFVFQAVGRCIC